MVAQLAGDDFLLSVCVCSHSFVIKGANNKLGWCVLFVVWILIPVLNNLLNIIIRNSCVFEKK